MKVWDRRFARKGWSLFDADWVRHQSHLASEHGYENDIAFVFSKILLREKGTSTLEPKAEP